MATMTASSNAASTSCTTANSDVNQQFCVRWNSHLGSIGAAFPQLLAGQRFVDVTLACEGHQVHCHRLVLAACSHYFENLLNDNPCKHPIIILPRDIRLWEIQALIDFMYKGEVNVSQAGLNDLLNCAEILQIRGLCGSNPGNGAGSNITNGCGDGEEMTENLNSDSFASNPNLTTTTKVSPILINRSNISSSNSLSPTIVLGHTEDGADDGRREDIEIERAEEGHIEQTRYSTSRQNVKIVSKEQNHFKQYEHKNASSSNTISRGTTAGPVQQHQRYQKSGQNTLSTVSQPPRNLQPSNYTVNKRIVSPSPLDTIAEVASYARTQCIGIDDAEEDDLLPANDPSYEIKCEDELIIDDDTIGDQIKTVNIEEDEDEDMDGSNSEKLQSEINHHFVHQQPDTQAFTILMPSFFNQPDDYIGENNDRNEQHQHQLNNPQSSPTQLSSTPQLQSHQQSNKYLNQNEIIRVKSIQNMSNNNIQPSTELVPQQLCKNKPNVKSVSRNNENSGTIRVVSPQRLISLAQQTNNDIVLPTFLKFNKKTMDIYVKNGSSKGQINENCNSSNMSQSITTIEDSDDDSFEMDNNIHQSSKAHNIRCNNADTKNFAGGKEDDEVVDIICSPNFMDLSYDENDYDNDIEIVYDSSNSDYKDDNISDQSIQQNMNVDISSIINPPPLIPISNLDAHDAALLESSTPLLVPMEYKPKPLTRKRSMKASCSYNHNKKEVIGKKSDKKSNNTGCDNNNYKLKDNSKKSNSPRTTFRTIQPFVSSAKDNRCKPCPPPIAFTLRNPRGNQPRTYTTEALWAALMDVKSGESIYRASQIHKVPRKTLRNWMKRWDIKSAYPMPIQLKQAAENKRRAKDNLLLKQLTNTEKNGTSANLSNDLNTALGSSSTVSVSVAK